jgi:hypothetical protein
MKQEIEEQLAVPFQTGSHQPLSNSDINAIGITAREDGKFSQYTQQYAVEPGHVYVLEVMSNDDLSIARDLDKCSWKNNGVRTRQGVKKTNYFDKDTTTGMRKTISVVEDENILVIQLTKLCSTMQKNTWHVSAFFKCLFLNVNVIAAKYFILSFFLSSKLPPT